jgi:hypothetical protein
MMARHAPYAMAELSTDMLAMLNWCGFRQGVVLCCI